MNHKVGFSEESSQKLRIKILPVEFCWSEDWSIVNEMEVDCKNEAIVKCIDEDGRVVVDNDSFSTEDTGVITYDF